jgi:hypothetical protein
MKSRTLKWITPTILFAVLALPTRVSAQTHHHYKLIDMGTFGGPYSLGATLNAGIRHWAAESG